MSIKTSHTLKSKKDASTCDGADWLYSDIVKDHFFNPRNILLNEENYEADGIGIVGSPACGDMMAVWIKVDPITKKIAECKWRTFGCASAIASTSMMSVMALENGGMNLLQAKRIAPEAIIEKLGGLPDRKYHCSVLGHLALREAVEDYEKITTMEKNKRKYKVLDNEKEAPGVATLRLSLISGDLPPYRPGQFINIYFPDTQTPEGKAYSLSSAPAEGGVFKITVKAIGEFSNKLCALHVGDIVIGSDPYGFFYSESATSPLLLLASGIGITPFRSIICESFKKTPDRKISLFYSNRTEDDIVFKKELDQWQKDNPHLTIVYFVTREEKTLAEAIQGRMSAKQIMKFIPQPKETEVFICGSISFVRDMWKGIKNEGVPEESIYTEAFFSH